MYSTKNKNKIHKKKNYKKNKHKAGKVLGEGNYGCIVHPAYSCSKSNKHSNLKNKVSKLSHNPDENPEAAIYSKLKKIKNYKHFFIFPEKSCIIKSVYIKKEDKKNCDIDLSKDPIHNSYMTKGDYDLTKVDNLSTKDAYKYLLKLLNSLQLLVKHNIGHFDIKALNIIIKNNEPFIIDFDDIFNPTNEYDLQDFLSNFSHMTDTYVWPPEIYYQFDHYSYDMPADIEVYVITATYKEFISNAMMFSLGLAFYQQFKFKDQKLEYLIQSMMEFDPRRRITISEAKKFIKSHLK